MAPKVWVGARSVVWAAVGQGECVPMHGGRDIGLWSPVGKVAIPFLMAGTKMLHLKERGLIRSTIFKSCWYLRPTRWCCFHVFYMCMSRL